MYFRFFYFIYQIRLYMIKIFFIINIKFKKIDS